MIEGVLYARLYRNATGARAVEVYAPHVYDSRLRADLRRLGARVTTHTVSKRGTTGFIRYHRDGVRLLTRVVRALRRAGYKVERAAPRFLPLATNLRGRIG